MEIEQTALAKPIVRTASSSSSVRLRHPTPDLQSLQGAYVGNVERLEQSAESLSMGSDIAEEIRRLQLEQKQSENRRGSIHSAAGEVNQEPKALPQNRSRNQSASSYTKSIVDVNNAARVGGYSPAGYVASSEESGRSRSWSQPSHFSVRRPRSISSRLGQVTGTDAEQDDTSPDPPENVSAPLLDTPQPPKQSSFSDVYDEIAHEIQHQFEPNTALPHNASSKVPRLEEEKLFSPKPPAHDVTDRPQTAASTDTYQQMGALFNDFDGAHGGLDQHSQRVAARSVDNLSAMRSSTRVQSYIQPPHGENMVYYPAPVPRMLNLPQRLSQMPAAALQAKRRQQLVESMPPEARKSAVWLSEKHSPGTETSPSPEPEAGQQRLRPHSGARALTDLPPQLRASAFFDHRSVGQDVEVKGDSAVATLESILEASAHAPVGAFTDHPIAGRVGSEVYGKEYGRDTAKRNTVSQISLDKLEHKKNRSSLNLLFHRKSGTDFREHFQNTNASRSSFASPLGEKPMAYEPLKGENPDDLDPSHERDDDPHGEHDLADPDDFVEDPEPDPDAVEYFGPPTTLLAELQLRKQELRQRNRTAATAFPNGMHSTLLELDAVAQVEKKRRMGQRVALAWEDPDIRAAEEADNDDDDVPLGVLFPARNGLANNAGHGPSDWDRPLGLIERREMEDNEPLSSRRNRLLGIQPARRDRSPIRASGVPEEFVDELKLSIDDGSDGEEETLAQRARRLNGQTLDATVDETSARPASGGFASELLIDLGIPQDGDNKNENTDSLQVDAEQKPLGNADNPVSGDEEETLGQRRKRLQAEALARANQPSGEATDAPIKAKRSLADLLTAHPAGVTRQDSSDALGASLTPGSLLQQNEQYQTQHRHQVLELNRMSSYGLEKPFLDVGDVNQTSGPRMSGLLANGFPNNAGMMPMQQQYPPTVTVPAGIGLGMYPSGGYMMPNNGMPMAGPNELGYGYPLPAQHMSMHGGGFGAFAFPQQNVSMQGVGGMNGFGGMPQMGIGMGADMGGMNGFGGMPQMGMGMGPSMGGSPSMAEPMDPRQRDMIDQWRQSVT